MFRSTLFRLVSLLVFVVLFFTRLPMTEVDPAPHRPTTPLTESLFLNFCWVLNVLHLSLIPAFLRFALHLILRPFAHENLYSSGEVAGYKSWFTVPLFGVVAFRRTDWSLQYRW